MNFRTFPKPKATKTISAPEMSFAAIFNKKEKLPDEQIAKP